MKNVVITFLLKYEKIIFIIGIVFVGISAIINMFNTSEIADLLESIGYLFLLAGAIIRVNFIKT